MITSVYLIFFRDGTIALLDQMVGTTTKATARQVAAPTSINPATQAAILAAAAVAQVKYNFIIINFLCSVGNTIVTNTSFVKYRPE